MSLRRYFKPANKLPTADEQRSIKSLPCHLRSPDGKRKKFIRNWLQNHETQTLKREAVRTLHVALKNGTFLHVNERQKIRHYRARSTEE